ncbi:MAG: glycosyltransferase family 4 protein [Acidimicrobiales bacterium]
MKADRAGLANGTGLRIAMIGQRGVPATFGGIERHVEELASRLAARGHEVTVFCRTNYSPDRRSTHRGMRLRHLPTIGTKHLDAITHSTLSTGAAMAGRFDVIHYHAFGPGLVAPLPRYLSRAKVVMTVHALDDERSKWSTGAQRILRLAQWMSARVPDRTIVVSSALADHYAARHHRSTTWIANGVLAPTPLPAREITERFGLKPRSYLLFVGRFVQEKAPDLLVEAFLRLSVAHPDLRLVLAGGSSFTDQFVNDLARLTARNDRVVLPGYAYGSLLAELYSNAAAFVLPSKLEGLPLTLLEAASYGTPVVASAIEPHVEVLGCDAPGHRLFSPGDVDDLAAAVQRALADPAAELAAADGLRDEVLRRYDWNRTAEQTEALYLAALTDRRPAHAQMTRPATPDRDPETAAR